jgi:integrase/recombinase XerD
MRLAQLIAQYVALRKARGESFDSGAATLESFARFLGEETKIDEVTADRVRAFLDGRGSLTRRWQAKYGYLLGFYRYAVSRGHAAASPLPTVIPKFPKSFVPYIYSREELRRLLDGTACYQKPRAHRKVHIEPCTFRTILLMLYGCGLRVSECLSLTADDLDLRDSVLTIRETKFYKSRLVPIGADLKNVLTRYIEQRKKAGYSVTGSVFTTRFGTAVPYPRLHRSFATLRQQTGVLRTNGGRFQPRLHDLRHTFAVHRVISWYKEGKDVQRLLPALSTYLGHKDIASTQVYLTMTPELLLEASTRFARYAFAEVGL